MTQEEKRLYMMQTDVRVLVAKLSIPTIITMLMTTIYNMADTYFVGQINTNATAAVGIVFPFMSIVQACGFFFGQGSGNYVSKALGRQDYDSAEKMNSTGFFSSVIFGVFIMLIGLTFKNSLVKLLGATDEMMSYTIDYLKYILIGAPFYAASLTLNNQFRFQGNAIFGTIGLSIGGFINVLLDALFILAFKMGVAGAALATAISQIISFVILVAGTFNKANMSVNLKSFTPRWFFYKEMFRTGTPSLFRQGLASCANLSMNYAAKAYAISAGFDMEAAVAAMSIVGKVTHLAYSVVIGFGQGFQPVCGFNYGAKKYDRVKKAYFFTVKITTVFMIAAGVLIFVFAPKIVGIFNDDVASIKNQVIGIGAKTLRITCSTFPLIGFLTLSNMMMQNLSLAFRASFLAMSRQGLFYIPLVFILPKIFGFTGIQVCQSVCDAISAVIAFILIKGVFKGKFNS